MTRERIAIDAWATHITPEGATRWPAEFIHIFNKYKTPAVNVMQMDVARDVFRNLVRDNVVRALKLGV